MITRKSNASVGEPDVELAQDTMTADVEEVWKKIQEELSIKDQKVMQIKLKKQAIDTSFDQQGSYMRLLNFDPPIQFDLLDSAQPLLIERVKIGDPLSLGCDYYGLSFMASSEDGSLSLMASLVRIEGSFYQTTQGRKKLHSICKRVEDLAKIRPNSLYCRPLGATVVSVSEKVSDLWFVTEPYSGISLERLLECSGHLSLSKSMVYIEQILQALQELHSNNVIHQDLVASNVMISTFSSKIRIVNPSLTRLLRDLHQTHPLSSKLEIPDDVSWRPPESLSKGNQSGKKADIWFVGHLTLQLLFGLDFPKSFGTVEDAFASISSRLPPAVIDFMQKIMANEPFRRLSASEAIHHGCFSADSFSDYQHHSLWNTPSESPYPIAGILDTPRRSVKAESSRFRTDFEEIQFLGKGAYGEVIKVRNRIDNRFYAIKRIRLDPSDVDYNSKILREVITLSRLHHERVVRYFQAWIEGGGSRSIHGMGSPYDSTDGSGQDSSPSEESFDEDWTNEGISSTRLYSSSIRDSTTSLSKMIQFHTGFTSEEESSPTSLALQTDTKSVEGPQSLYIQMEYCPNQTLRDVIDMGIEEEETWRLFRQIVEGLSYLHSQGMIHRDLKPGNIFLDTNGDVKIGDFGLAVGNDRERLSKAEEKASISNSEDIETLTGGIGTPLYVSPEQKTPGARYNQKVDMYSLGIILLEMLVHFHTGMERAVTIKSARSPEIMLPDSILKPEKLSGMLIIKNLLSHDPKLRFSADELLKSELLPAKVEDEYVNEVIRTISSMNSPYYSKLLSSVFSQNPDIVKNHTFDYHADIARDPIILMGLDEISGILAATFRKYGAVRIDPSLLLPKEECDSELGPVLLMPSGQQVYLPQTLVRPFARYVAIHGVSDMKRFQIGCTYTGNISGGQPKQSLEASYDIVFSSQDSLLPILETIRVTLDALVQNTLGLSLAFTMRLNNQHLIGPILGRCLVPTSKIAAVMGVFAESQQSSWPKIKSVLASQVVLPPSTIESIGKLATLKDLNAMDALKRLNEHLRGVKECLPIIRFLESLVLAIPSLGISTRIAFDPLFCLGVAYCGFVFQVSVEDRKKSEVLACGGEYKDLINHYRIPSDRVRHVSAIGASFQLGRIWTLRSSRGMRFKRESPILVYSSGTDMLNEKLHIAAELWSAGLMVEILCEENVAPDFLSHVVRLKGIILAVHLKDHCSRGPFGVVKLKNYEKRQEAEVARSDLLETITKFLSHQERQSSSDSNINKPSSSHSPVNVSLFSPFSKIKGNQKSMIMDKTMRAITPLLTSFTGAGPIEVIAHDLSKGLIRHIVDTLGEGEEVFRRLIESSDREAALKMRNHLKGLKSSLNLSALLYNYREENIELVTF